MHGTAGREQDGAGRKLPDPWPPGMKEAGFI